MSDYASELPIRSQYPGQALPDDVIVKLGDGSNPTTQLGTILAASTGAAASNTALVVALSPNTPIPAGTNLIGSVNQGTSPWITKDQSDGSVTGGTAGTYSMLMGGQYNTALPSLTAAQQAALQLDSSGRLIIAPLTSGSTVTVIGNLTNNNAAPAANNVGALVALAEGTVSASRYTSGDQVLLVTDLAGNTNIDLQYFLGSAVSKTNPIFTTVSDGTNVLTSALSAYGTAPTGTFVQGVNAFITNVPAVSQSGTWTVQPGNTPNTVPWLVTVSTALPSGTNIIGKVEITDGTNTVGVAPASTAATATQPAEVVALSPNSPLPAGTNAIGSVLANLQVSSAPVSVSNPVPVTVTSASAGTPIQNFTTLTAIAAGANATATYTVPATHSFSFEQIFVSAENRIKIIVANNGTTILTAFNSSANPNIEVAITAPPTVAAGNAITVQVFNIDNGASNAYVSIMGNQIS